MLHCRFALPNSYTNQIVEIAVRQAFNVEIDRRAGDLQLRTADYVDFLFPDRERLQRVMILFPLVPLLLGTPTRPKRVGELGDREDAFAVKFLALLFRHEGQQAEIVLLRRLLVAAGLELTLCAMPVQNEIRGQRAEKLRRRLCR